MYTPTLEEKDSTAQADATPVTLGQLSQKEVHPLLEDDDNIINRYDMNSLLNLGYAISDLMLADGKNTGATTTIREQVILDYINLRNRFAIESRGRFFFNSMIEIALTYAHCIRSARRRLLDLRAECAAKRDDTLRIEMGLSWINSLLKLSGQLFMIGGLVGIACWLIIGEAKVSGDPIHQTLLSVAIAIASMLLTMGLQLRSQTLSNRSTHYAYQLGLDKAKEEQARSLEEGLIRTQVHFSNLLKKIFGEDFDTTSKANIESELRIFEQLKHVDDPNREASYFKAFKDWLASLLPWQNK